MAMVNDHCGSVALTFSIITHFFLNPKPSDIGLKVETSAKPIEE